MKKILKGLSTVSPVYLFLQYIFSGILAYILIASQLSSGYMGPEYYSYVVFCFFCYPLAIYMFDEVLRKDSRLHEESGILLKIFKWLIIYFLSPIVFIIGIFVLYSRGDEIKQEEDYVTSSKDLFISNLEKFKEIANNDSFICVDSVNMKSTVHATNYYMHASDSSHYVLIKQTSDDSRIFETIYDGETYFYNDILGGMRILQPYSTLDENTKNGADKSISQVQELYDELVEIRNDLFNKAMTIINDGSYIDIGIVDVGLPYKLPTISYVGNNDVIEYLAVDENSIYLKREHGNFDFNNFGTTTLRIGLDIQEFFEIFMPPL